MTTTNVGRRIDEAAIEALRSGLRGEVITPGDDHYDQARAVYNGMIDKRPGVVTRCVDVADVITAVNFGREESLEVAVRGGGHNGAGFGVVNDGLVIDLAPMRWVHVDPEARTAQVGGGTLLGDLDHATHAFGLATPTGVLSTTGIAGLTLSGGHGYLTRQYGLTIDNLVGVDLVLADGSFVQAGPGENEDLFWAVRGGGGNFGVATSFTFRLHPVHTVTAAITLWTIDQAADVLRWYRDFLPQAPEELYGFFAFLVVPPGPPFPEEIHLKNMCGIVWCHTSAVNGNGDVLAPVRDAGQPAFEFVTPMPYPALQGMFDPLYPPGLQWYWRGDFFDRITDEAIDVHVEFGSRVPTMHSTMHLYPTDGAPHRIGPHETAWSYRDAVWSGVIGGIDPDPANAETIKQWCVDYWAALHPQSMGGAYPNFMMEEGDERVRAAYRGNYDRLRTIKESYDPGNFFHINQNIRPAT